MVKGAKSAATLGAGFVTGEIATGLCTPRDLSEGERSGFAAAVGFAPPLIDIMAACSAAMLYEIYRPISDYAYSEAELAKYRAWGVTLKDLDQANQAWQMFQAGNLPRP